MSDTELHAVTGAFSYSGKYIARLLLEKGQRVRTLTGHPDRPDPLRERIEAKRLAFDDYAALVENLRGASVFYNTYWVRFDYGEMTFDRAVENTKTLFRAAVEAGVKRFVHVSITNPSEDSSLPYFRGKAVLERELEDSGLSYAVLRPTVLFGREDILINNITWLLRKFPVFGVVGSGEYRMQPVYVGDLAALAVEVAGRSDNVVLDAVGPETYTYSELVRLIARHIGRKARLVRVPAWLLLLAGRMLGWFLRDVVITRDEIAGLSANLLVSHGPPTCPTRFSEWLPQHAAELGSHYHSELARRWAPPNTIQGPKRQK